LGQTEKKQKTTKMKGKLCNIFEKKLKTDRFYDEIESTTVWEILGEIFGVDFGGPSL